MKRKIIHINEEKCNGCGLCVDACHEGAIGMVEGKARLLREDYCDGLGDCLPACPTGAITFEEREALGYDETAVQKAKQSRNLGAGSSGVSGCPGAQARILQHGKAEDAAADPIVPRSQLTQWPVQIKLMPVNASYYQGADLLIAADCTAFAYGSFHNDLMKGRITLIGCPKLDDVDYAAKLIGILQQNEIKSITVARMEVPCCGGLEMAVARALKASRKEIPLRVVVITTEGGILEERDEASA